MSKNSTTPAFALKNVTKEFAMPSEHLTSIRARFASLFRKRSWKRFTALSDVSLEIQRGEFFGIIGRNGSGKSTLLKSLAGILAPTRGSIEVHGAVSPFLELGVGFNPELTARDNIFLNGAVLGMSQKDIEERYDAVINFAELAEFQDVKLKNFSSGMYVRLAFSVAIHAPSDILLMDEVLAVGDERFQEKCTAVFEDLKKRGKTVVLVSHDMHAIEKFCHRVLVMEKGRPLTIAPAKEATQIYHALNDQQSVDIASIADMQESATQPAALFPVQIQGVRYLSSSGIEVSEIQSGDPLTVEVSYEITSEAHPKHCGIALFSSTGAYVFGTNTLLDNAHITFKKKGTFALTYPHLNLAPGSYSVQTGVFGQNDSDVLGFFSESPDFTVLAKTPFQGTTIFEHNWNSPLSS